MKNNKKFSKKYIINIFIVFYIVFIFICSFLNNLERQSYSYPLYGHDQARDIHVSYFINRYGENPDYAPWCGNCRSEYHLINSKIYYYLLAPFSFTSDGSSLLYFCAFWFSLVIPLVFVLASLISNKYAGVLAATIMFQTGFMKYITLMPYQPFFTSTMSVIFLIFLILAKKKNSVFYFFLSSITLFLGVQFHLSFVPLTILYMLIFWRLFKKLGSSKKILLFLIIIVFSFLFLFFNTDFIINSQGGFIPMQIASFENFKEILKSSLITDYENIFGEHFIFLYIFLFFLVLNFKKIKYKFLFLIFGFYLFLALGSHTDNIFTAPYIPLFIVLFSSVVINSKNKFLFVLTLFLVIFLNPNRISIEYLKNIKITNPVFGSQKVLFEMNKALDQFIEYVPNYCVYMCEGNFLLPSAGFNFYRNQINKSRKSYFDSACNGVYDITNGQKNFLYSLDRNDCQDILKSENNLKLYNFEKIYSQNGRYIYSIIRKY